MSKLTFSDVVHGMEFEDYIDSKEDILQMIHKYNIAATSGEKDKIYDEIQKLINGIDDESYNRNRFNGRTTQRYEFGNVHGGKYRE